jgi:hypothetical protein
MKLTKTFRVVEMTVAPGLDPVVKTVKGNLSQGKAKSLQEKLEETIGDFTPEKVVSYIVEPA